MRFDNIFKYQLDWPYNLTLTYQQESQNLKAMLTPRMQTMIGVMMIFFSAGFIGDWGIYSIYILSYYHFHGAPLEIKASTNSIMMILLIIPVTFCLIYATKIAARIGYQRCIKICAIQFLLVPLVCFFSFSFVVFMLFSLLIPLTGFALALIPIFHCMYSHFGQNKSMATGAAIFSFGIGSIMWNLIITMAVNPENIIPDIETADPNLSFFPQQIADKIPRTLNYVYLISGILFVIASFLISNNKDYKDQHVGNNEQIQVQTSATQADYQPIDLLKYLKHKITIMLFVFNITACIYQVYYQLNTKLIYMSTLQDDHLISLGLVLSIFSSAVCSIFWGSLADFKGPPLTIIVFLIVDFAAKIYATLSRSRVGFIISSIALGSTDKTMLILFAPILIDCFGLKVGSQLLPFKGLSGMLSVILSIILGYFFTSFSTPNTALYCLCGFSIFNVGFGIWLARSVRNEEIKRENKQKGLQNPII